MVVVYSIERFACLWKRRSINVGLKTLNARHQFFCSHYHLPLVAVECRNYHLCEDAFEERTFCRFPWYLRADAVIFRKKYRIEVANRHVS
jgi:hypothetical protein